MSESKRNTALSSKPTDDLPELDDAFFAQAEIRDGDRLVRRGRPPVEWPKVAIKLRLDPDIVAHFRAEGPGWQTRINDTLRRSVERTKKRPAALK